MITHSNYNGIRNAVLAFLRANHFPVTAQFSEQLDENLCENGARCEEWLPPSAMDKLSTVAKALFRAAKDWRKPLVSAEELERRRSICAECNYYGGSRSLLKVACSRCGCGGLKLSLQSEHCPLPEPKW